MDRENLKIIKQTVEDFFSKMTFNVQNISAEAFIQEGDNKNEAVELFIKIDEPQVLIGEKGQTLVEIQKLLRMILNKKLKSVFYINLDINDYKKKKSEYLKRLAKDLAQEVAFSRKEKSMLPMTAYERRVVHAELASRDDIKTESRGDGPDRYIVVLPKKPV